MIPQYLNISEDKNGNLLVSATIDGIEYLTEKHDEEFDSFDLSWSDLLESFSVNGSYQFIYPEELGWLTEAPIIGLCERDEEYKLTNDETNKFWFFGDYMVRNELLELTNGETIIFTLHG